MSYDFSLEVPNLGNVKDPSNAELSTLRDEPLDGRLDGSWRNYTSNVGPMFRLAGLESPREWSGRSAGDMVKPLQVAIAAMKTSPEQYRAMNPANGWGDYDGALAFLEHCELWCRAFPQTIVYLSS